MRILVSGAAGFIGSHLTEHLLVNTDWEIVVLDSLNYAGDANRLTDSEFFDRERVKILWHDLRAPINDDLAGRIGPVDYIINMASESHVDRSIIDPVPFVHNNVMLALHMLEFARRAVPEVFIQVSTDEVFGPAEGPPHREWSIPLPSNPYCLVPGTLVITNRGPVAIEDFDVVQNRALSRSETHSNVLSGLVKRRWEFQQSGEIVEIHLREGGETLRCTPGHKLFVAINSHRSGGRKMVEKRAGDVAVGDRVCIVRELPIPGDFTEPDPRYARFLGYWMGDGSFGGRHRYVRLADQSRDRILRYRELIGSYLGVSPKSKTGAFGNVYKHGSKDCWYLQFASERLRGEIDLSDRLNVSEQAMQFPRVGLGEFIAGWIDADGSVGRDSQGRVVNVAISCYDSRLRVALKFLFRRLGVLAVDSESSQKVSVTDAASLERLLEVCPTDKWPENPQFRKAQSQRGKGKRWAWAVVTSVKRGPYDGKVYDLQVEPHHNYLANYALVHNSASKAAQEAIAISYWRSYGVPVVVTNTMNNIGQRQHPEKFLPLTVRRLLQGEAVSIHGQQVNGRWESGARMWLHARNHADALLYILRRLPPAYYPMAKRPDRYNVVGDKEITNLGIVRMVAEILGVEPLHEFTDAHSERPGHDLRYALDGSKLKGLGWEPPVDLEESFKRTVLWFAERNSLVSVH